MWGCCLRERGYAAHRQGRGSLAVDAADGIADWWNTPRVQLFGGFFNRTAYGPAHTLTRTLTNI
jgi:hypothetical protein